MKRLLPFLLLVVTIGLCGCQRDRRQTQDPFFGRTTVPPPVTGTLSGQTGDPGYQGIPGPITNQPITPDGPAWRAQPGNLQPGPSQPINSQPATNPGDTPNYVPPDGEYRYRGSWLPKSKAPTTTRVSIPTFADGTSTGNTDTADDAAVAVSRVAMNPRASSSLAGRERVIRILQPRPEPAGDELRTGTTNANLNSSSGQPRTMETPGEAVDIMDLPRAG